MNNKVSTAILLIICCLCSVCFSQKRIEKSKKELKESSNSNNNSNTSSSTRSNSRSSSSSFGENFMFDVFVYATYGIVKYGFIGDYKNEDHLYNNLSYYPFKDGSYGNFNSNDSISRSKMRLDVENSFIYNSNTLFGNHLKVKIRPFQYFYLQTDYHQLFEFDRINNKNYDLSIFQFNLCYDRIRMDKFNFGWNLGATYIGNDVKKAGFAYGLNADYFLNRNISFSGSAKWSTINSQPVNTFELQGKFHKKNFIISFGLEHLKIATPTYNFVTLGGGIYF